ncbi:TVP38/TMEM64 family protein [Candidatus Sumerlaeota bacterium]|nr:TVP38/TMEM64 family protein [Candidatus Sumerlaeota bacterium]
MSDSRSSDRKSHQEASDVMEDLVGEDGLPLKKKKSKGLKRDIALIVTIVVVLALVGYYMKHYVDVQHFKAYLHPDGSFKERVESYVIFVLAMGLLIALGFPRVLVCGVGGAVYGAALGIVLNTAASVLGALGPYQIGKSVLRRTMKRRLGRHFETWKRRFQRNGFLWTLNLRLLPGANATLTGVICGACKVKVLPYIAATALGTIPQTAIFSMLGSGATGGKNYQIFIGAGIFIVVALAQGVYLRNKKKKEAEQKAATEKL